jgi:integrase
MAKRPKLRRGFYWRKSTIWVRTDPVDGVQRSTKCSDPEAAYLWEAERQREAANPAHAAAKKATVRGAYRRALDVKAAKRSAGTLHMYGVKLGHVLRVFGAESSLSELGDPRAIDRYMEQRAGEGAGANTIKRELTCLTQMLKLAKREGEFPYDIAGLMPVGFSAEYVPTKRTLKRADLPKLLAALPSDTERAWVCLAIAFAADVSDIEKMLPEHFDPASQQMHVQGTKTDTRDAWLPVLPQFAPLVAYAVPLLPVSWPHASGALGRACKRAGLPHLSPKDLRRTAASWLIADGANQSLVSRFLRHSSDAMVRKVYGQLTPAQLGGLLGKSNGTETVQLTVSLEGNEQEPAGNKAKAPWRNGRRRGLKRLQRQNADSLPCWFGRKHAARLSTSTHATAAQHTPARTETLHAGSQYYEPSVWALAYAARAVGL